jgi:hypothetical protein
VCLGFHPFGVSGVRDRKLPHKHTRGYKRPRKWREEHVPSLPIRSAIVCNILVTRAFRRLARGGGNKKNKKQKKLANIQNNGKSSESM